MAGQGEEKLSAPSVFMKAPLTGVSSSSALLTPSHFTCTPPCPARSVLPHGGTDPYSLLTHPQQQAMQLPQERHQQLHTDSQHSQHTSLVEELREEVRRLKEQLGQQERVISRQAVENKRLCSELQQNRQQVCERHSSELSALTHTNSELQKTLQTVTQEVTSLRHLVEEVTSERDTLKEQLSSVSRDLKQQNEALHKLRNYIGSQPGEEEQHTHLQKLQKEKEALCLSVELLNVRVKSANDILALQERELTEQCDPLQKARSNRLLSLWREKVFMLLVQLRSRDSQLHMERTQLQNMVSDLQQEIQKLQSHIALLQHNLQDKTAQLQLHNIHTQELQQQVCSVLEENERLKQHKEMTETSAAHMTDTVHRMSVCVGQWESQIEVVQSQMSALTQRLGFANGRLDTVHGLLLRKEALWKAQRATQPAEPAVSESCIERLQSQVALLSSERDTLALELRRTPELISSALRELQLQLDRSREGLQVSELQRLEVQTHCEEQDRSIEELRAEVQHTQTVLQEKLSEAESVCAKQLRDMETQLNTARREHTKAVVALRQVERAAEREREQEREAERVRSEHTLTQISKLHTQLKEKDRDCNILLAVVQQQGLMNEYKRMRRAAIHTSKALMDQQPQHTHQKQNQQQHQCREAAQQEGCVLSVLDELRALSSAAVHSSEDEGEEEDEEEYGQGETSLTHTHTLNTLSYSNVTE